MGHKSYLEGENSELIQAHHPKTERIAGKLRAKQKGRSVLVNIHGHTCRGKYVLVLRGDVSICMTYDPCSYLGKECSMAKV